MGFPLGCTPDSRRVCVSQVTCWFQSFKTLIVFWAGALATVGALTYGLFSFVRGDTRMQQLMMRARVAAQGGTIVAVAGGVVYMLFRDHQDKKGQR